MINSPMRKYTHTHVLAKVPSPLASSSTISILVRWKIRMFLYFLKNTKGMLKTILHHRGKCKKNEDLKCCLNCKRMKLKANKSLTLGKKKFYLTLLVNRGHKPWSQAEDNFNKRLFKLGNNFFCSL